MNRKKNGELYYVERLICSGARSEGSITHFIANGRDLTDRVRLEEQLLQAQKMDAIGHLAGGVAHDFNNLLTIITSYSELALDAVPQDRPLEAKIQEILLGGTKGSGTDAATARLQPETAPGFACCRPESGHRRIAKTLPRLISEDIEFTFSPGDGLGQVRVDPVQIEQVLMNLAANARDAMPQGGRCSMETSDVRLERFHLRINKRRSHGALCSDHRKRRWLRNSSRGPAHIFEPFYTTKPAGKGTGLGLATVYGIVKQNKGFIWASVNQTGHGFQNLFALHCRAILQNAGGHREAPPTGASETVLLVEDEPAVRRATAEFLALQGYSVLEAKDGVDALAVAGALARPSIC